MIDKRIYRGEPPGKVKVILETGRCRPLHHVILHSPTGFAWGYGGSGPADLALSILCDVLEEHPKKKQLYGGDFQARDHYQQFKWEYIATWPFDGKWEIDSDTILCWLMFRGMEV
ncbi:MAG: hypothetical protein PHQ40_07745 [Anaerolineaceae bacterium]|nr:hypothetical protein [Anaerolineaceae bacterium]